MKKKKFLALLLTGAMALAALTGCSGGTETTEESTGGDASAESGDGTYKIALIQQHQTNAFQIGVTEGAQAKADELGVEDYFWQEGGAAEESFIPPFDLTGV